MYWSIECCGSVDAREPSLKNDSIFFYFVFMLCGLLNIPHYVMVRNANVPFFILCCVYGVCTCFPFEKWKKWTGIDGKRKGGRARRRLCTYFCYENSNMFCWWRLNNISIRFDTVYLLSSHLVIFNNLSFKLVPRNIALRVLYEHCATVLLYVCAYR